MSKIKHVIFGTGPVGRNVMQTLIEQGESVRMINRSGSGRFPENVEIVSGDAADKTFAREVTAGAELVYYCLNVPYPEWFTLLPLLQDSVVQAAAAANARLVAVDNLYMYDAQHGVPITEEGSQNPPTRKGKLRRELAQRLLASHHSGEVQVVIGRASDFIGPGVENTMVSGKRVIAPILAGKDVSILADPARLHTYTSVADVGRALVALGQREDAFGQVWHLPSAPTVTTGEYVQMLYEAAGTKGVARRVPRLALRALRLFSPMIREVLEMQYQFEIDFIMDDTKFTSIFGGMATPIHQVAEAMVRHHRDQQRTSAD